MAKIDLRNGPIKDQLRQRKHLFISASFTEGISKFMFDIQYKIYCSSNHLAIYDLVRNNLDATFARQGLIKFFIRDAFLFQNFRTESKKDGKKLLKRLIDIGQSFKAVHYSMLSRPGGGGGKKIFKTKSLLV